jgi:hypothetical protein
MLPQPPKSLSQPPLRSDPFCHAGRTRWQNAPRAATVSGKVLPPAPPQRASSGCPRSLFRPVGCGYFVPAPNFKSLRITMTWYGFHVDIV